MRLDLLLRSIGTYVTPKIFTSSRIRDTAIFCVALAALLLGAYRAAVGIFHDPKLVICHDSWIYYHGWQPLQISVLDRGTLKPRNQMMSAGVELIGGSSVYCGAESPVRKPLYKSIEATVQTLNGNWRTLHSAGMKWDCSHGRDERRRSSASILPAAAGERPG